MRPGLVKVLIVLVILLFLFRSVSGFSGGLGNQCTGCGGCPGCGKNAWGHKTRDLTYSDINPWQSVDNKVVYY